MMGTVVIFIAKFLSPIGLLVALAIGAAISWRGIILVGGIVAATLEEFLLQYGQVSRQFSVGILLIGAVALTIWAAIGNLWLRKLLFKKVAK